MSLKASMSCIICFDVPDRIVLLPCGNHAYCLDCFKHTVGMAVKDESAYPVLCDSLQCEKISDKFVVDALASEGPEAQPLLRAFEAKAEEHQVLGKDRTYCSNEKCVLAIGFSKYLNYSVFGSSGKVICPECNGTTCCTCKAAVSDRVTHTCEQPNYYHVLDEFVSSVPEDERWLWQKCFSCGRWTDKIDACNHMTCNCKAQFCLICGRPWEGLVNCHFGCPKNDAPVYDEDGYNQNGFHRETGLDREGNPWKNEWDEDGNGGWVTVFDDEGFDQEGFDWWGIDRDGYDRDGFNMEGEDREGYSKDGFNREGRDRGGFDYWGWNEAGFDRNGFDRTGRDANGFFEDGYDMESFGANGVGLRGLPRDAYDENGYDANGWTIFGLDCAGFDGEGYGTDGYSLAGLNRAGYDRYGFAANGFTADGYDRFGKTTEGYRRSGYNSRHRNANNEIEPGSYQGPDGNCRRTVDEGPSAEVMECDHHTRHAWSGATCVVCHWHSDLYHRHCEDCGARFCRDCVNYGVERQRMSLRHQYIWPGSESYGIEEMFEREGEAR